MLRVTIWDELRRLRDEGKTLVVTTQYVSEAEFCDRVALIADGELIALDTPGELRKLVFGGEVIEVKAQKAVDAEVPGVVNVRQSGPRTLVVTTEDAGAASPRIIEVLQQAGIGVAEIEEHQPTFDEVFTGLVEKHRAGGND